TDETARAEGRRGGRHCTEPGEARGVRDRHGRAERGLEPGRRADMEGHRGSWARQMRFGASAAPVAARAVRGGCGGYFALPRDEGPPSAKPKALPELQFQDGTGRARSLADFRGKVVLLNVWATWCTPCREEMPALDRLQAKLGGPDFEVVAL